MKPEDSRGRCPIAVSGTSGDLLDRAVVRAVYVAYAPDREAGRVGRALFDDVVGSLQHRRRYREADRLRGLEVDRQLELRGLLDGKVGWLGAFELSA
jgi:hypothetical protein